MLSTALYSASQVRQLDSYAIDQCGIPELVLMKRAGKAAFDCLLKKWPHTKTIHICCGSGNNGGDGYVIAALAAQRALSVTVWSVSEKLTSAASAAKEYAVQAGAHILPWGIAPFTQAVEQSAGDAVVVDALLGTGAEGELRNDYKDIVLAINQSRLPVLAIDIPTGVNADTGAVAACAIKADMTISLIGQKLGNVIGDGRAHSGQRQLSDLAVPSNVYQQLTAVASVLNLDDWRQQLPQRSLTAHKGDCGHLLVVGGDHHFGGAPLMAAQMALRTGAGLVGLVTQQEHVAAALVRQPEVMVAGVVSGQAFLPLLSPPTVLVVGPGLGQTAWSEQLLYHCLESGKPMVVDADGLNILARGRLRLPQTNNHVITPHPGEAARLLGCSIADVQSDRVAAVNALQRQYGGTIVLKGAGTLVLTSRQQLYVCDAGNPAMASGGMGDVLAGLLGSLIAQGMSIDEATCLGVQVHSQAADEWVARHGGRGLLATDLIEPIRQLLEFGDVH